MLVSHYVRDRQALIALRDKLKKEGLYKGNANRLDARETTKAFQAYLKAHYGYQDNAPAGSGDGVFGQESRKAAKRFMEAEKDDPAAKAMRQALGLEGKPTPAVPAAPSSPHGNAKQLAVEAAKQTPQGPTPAPKQQAATPADPHGISAIGDSYAVGANAYGRGAANGIAKIGMDMGYVEKKEIPAMAARGIKEGILYVGTNDANVGRPLTDADKKTFQDRAENMLTAADRKGIRIAAWVGPTTVDPKKFHKGNEAAATAYNKNLAKMDEFLSEVAQKHHIPYISLQNKQTPHAMPASGLDHAGDGLHLQPGAAKTLWNHAKSVSEKGPTQQPSPQRKWGVASNMGF